MQQRFVLQALRSTRHQVYRVNTMPTRQEVLDGLRVIAKEIMQSLRILTMLFTMTKAVNPGEEVSETEMNPLNQLIQESAQSQSEDHATSWAAYFHSSS
jgi:hypothetical protein